MNNKCWRGTGEKRTFLRHWWDCKLVTATVENSTETPQKPKDRDTVRSSTCTVGLYLERTVIWKCLHSTIYSTQIQKKTYYTSTDAWIRNFVHLYKTRKHLVSLVTRPCLSLCDTMDRSMPGFPVHHQFLELAQIHVYQDGDATEPSHPLSSPSPPVFNLAQHQGLFQWVSSSLQVAKVLEFQL